MRKLGAEHLFLPVTWPYHRALRHHTLEPARRLAESATEDELRKNIDDWRTIKCQELDFVKAAGALSAAAVIGIFSWTTVPTTFWLAQALFYASLSLSIWAVITASQQTTLINALRSTDKLKLEEVYSTAQIILRFKTDLDDIEGYAASYYRGPEALGKRGWTARNIIYVWQCPLMLMSWGLGSLLLGLSLHVFSPLIAGDATWDEIRIAIFYLAVGLGLFVNFLWTSASTYWTSRLIYGMERFLDPADVHSRTTSRNPTGASTRSRGAPNDPVGEDIPNRVQTNMSEMSKFPKRDSYSVSYPKRDGTFGQGPVF